MCCSHSSQEACEPAGGGKCCCCVCAPCTPAPCVYNPGPAVPQEIRTGLLEIHDAIRKQQNPKGAYALCWDVLDMILDHAQITWPGSGKAKEKPAPLPAAAEMAGVLTISVIAGLAMIFVVRLGRDAGWLGRLCGDCAVEANLPVTRIMAVLGGLFLGALVGVGIMAFAREQWLKRPPASASSREPPTREQRLEALDRHRAITPDLLAWGLQIGINKPVKPKPGESKPPPAKPQPGATHAGVQLLGSFILALADQIFEAPRKVAMARVGAWPCPQTSSCPPDPC